MITNIFIRRLEIPDIKWEKLHYRPWRKLIARLVKMFNLPPEISPCLNKKRNEGALQFLLHKRFVENSFGALLHFMGKKTRQIVFPGDESWKEMVQEAVQDDEVLQKELVAQVAIYGSTEEALMWADHYGISKEQLPYNLRMSSENKNKYVNVLFCLLFSHKQGAFTVKRWRKKTGIFPSRKQSRITNIRSLTTQYI